VEYKLPVRVLALDTTTPRGSLAVAGDGGLLAEARIVTSGGHSRWVLGAAEALLQGLDLEPAALDGFAVTVGPGSFTGLRVGISSIQGLGLASGRPCVGLSTLDVLALAGAGRAPRVVTLMDAFRGETYSAVYDGDGRPCQAAAVGLLEPLLDALVAGPEMGGEIAFVGDAAVARRETIAARVPRASFPEVDLFLAVPLARAALARLRAGEGEPAAALRPLYLRPAAVRPPPWP
jgi:tRNA threonylcarbamoyladenosine biosynthesis protein TsaB